LDKKSYGTVLLRDKTTENNNKYLIKTMNLSETKDITLKEKIIYTFSHLKRTL